MVTPPKTPKKEYSMEELEAQYNDITVLYDYAEELVSTVESQFVQDPEAQMEIVEPLINEISDATDMLGEEFILVAETLKGKAGASSKSRVEGALRKIYVAINDYQARVKGVKGSLKNIADPIVAKIQRQVEKIVAMFLEFVQISLFNIMNKAEVEALRVRNTTIAMMMHQQAMGQQQ